MLRVLPIICLLLFLNFPAVRLHSDIGEIPTTGMEQGTGFIYIARILYSVAFLSFLPLKQEIQFLCGSSKFYCSYSDLKNNPGEFSGGLDAAGGILGKVFIKTLVLPRSSGSQMVQ